MSGGRGVGATMLAVWFAANAARADETDAASTAREVTELLARFDGEPDIQLVHAWANVHAQTSPSTVAAWMQASRTFAALPQLTLEVRLKDGWDHGFAYTTRDGDPLESPSQDAYSLLDDAGRDRDVQYLARARWDLDELVMSSERIRVINEAREVTKLRDKVLSEVTRLYFERRRLQVDRMIAPRSDLTEVTADQLRLAELEAGLDALTGGRFSAAVNRVVEP